MCDNWIVELHSLSFNRSEFLLVSAIDAARINIQGFAFIFKTVDSNRILLVLFRDNAVPLFSQI